MKWSYLLVSLVLLSSMAYSLVASPISQKDHPSSSPSNVQLEGRLVREKRAPLGKLALLGGAAVLGKKALLLGGAAVGAKALIGAGIVGAGLYKAKYYGGGYGSGYGGGYTAEFANHHYEWRR